MARLTTRFMRLVSTGSVAMGEYPAVPLPSEVTFWKLNIRYNNNHVLEYSDKADYTLTMGQTIDSILTDYLNGTFAIPWLGRVTEGAPKRLPLSIECNTKRYFVFVLDAGNYEFSDKQYPFTVESGKEIFYFLARAVWKDAGTVYIKRRASAGSSCRLAYFLAYGDEDLADSGRASFVTSFNIYLDIMVPQTQGAPRPVPISVDPDVGYPGGNR